MQQTLPLGQTAACEAATDWVNASSKEGSSATIRGPVVTTTYRKLVNGAPTYLNMGAAFPDRSRVTVVIWGKNRTKFSNDPEAAYDGKNVAVTGVVSDYRGTLQMVINSPSAIEVCGAA